MDAVLMKGPYTLRNIPLMLKEWKPDFNLKRDMLRTIPLWVKLPKLPLHLWGAKSLSKIGSALGVPLVIDECTANKLENAIKDCEGRRLMQPVEYEWKPLYCERCNSIGYKCSDYVKKQWKPKGKDLETAASNPKQVNIVVEKPAISEKGSEVKQSKAGIDEKAWTEARSTIKDRETRVKLGKAKVIRDKLGVHNNFVDNYQNHANGRIWVSWNENTVDVKVVKSSDQFVHCGIYDTRGNFQFWLTAIYGMNQLELRKRLWKDIAAMKPNAPEPWCLMGDFNNVLKAQDRIGGD
ncbi:uncharacterized protein LOC131657658 [Vicia villosa]|uniref:uncharacterized protein LOC131657658 n=1 Tax=Vicia villosa TaxID=3911 RepID=UPI00273A790C|nr:uncharacterized protein LOC131657658 [Vicia villosa]